MNSNRPKFYIYLPIIFALILVLGIFVGATFNWNKHDGIIPIDGNYKYNKLGALLRYVQQEYVDTVDEKKWVDETIVQLLQNLDPHSTYITADELQASNEPLTGHFGGVGIEFNIVNDTVCVVAVIAGGPSEKIGVKAGDKIISADGKKISGVKITNRGVMEQLKGKIDTKVTVKIKRGNSPKLLDFSITRGTIPIYSIDVSSMLSDDVGYIKISRFAATTYDEYMNAFIKLKKQGMKKLVLDLRGNGGGFLNTAVDLADEFLSSGKEIVYTQGKARPRKDYIATHKGDFESGELIILIDEESASASEILAGAIQDNDRGTIIGRRSFGKGLVQEQSEFSDGSAIRLTIARYYTPTGRCIQKPYANGIEEYYAEESNRYKKGEFENKDSIKVADSLKFKTPGGKIVYGGGGIIPDIFVPLEVSGITHYINQAAGEGLITDFAFNYADKERMRLKRFKTVEQFNKSFEIKPALFQDFITYCTNNHVQRNDREIKKSEHLIKLQLKALIARNIWNNEGYYAVLQAQDNVLTATIKYIDKQDVNKKPDISKVRKP
jgi:carboxyl-terminal processing protease